MKLWHVLATLLFLPLGAAAAPGDTPPADQAADNAPYNVLGDPQAPVSIIEYSDLQCPFCARFARETFPRIKSEYIDTGKVRYAVADFPLPMHPQAVPAAIALRCAGEQGQFWTYREQLYKDQMLLVPSLYELMAQQLGLDVTRFNDCRNDPQQRAAVEAAYQYGARNKIASTPTFVVGRVVDGQDRIEVIEGAKPIDVFRKTIDALLEAAQ
ncbi:MAG TPA: DsbA family protein [Steroidobacteraceae bacterium]|nr:DsbA family protein [Steroidobacteraceae bacterium]